MAQASKNRRRARLPEFLYVYQLGLRETALIAGSRSQGFHRSRRLRELSRCALLSGAYTSSSSAYHNIGWGTGGASKNVDVGRMAVTGKRADWGAFKTPSMRNVTRTSPYGHDGSATSLIEAVTVLGGGIDNPNLDQRMHGRALSCQEAVDLTAFLGSLLCEDRLTRPKRLP